MADQEMRGRITYEDRFRQIIDVVDGNGRVYAQLVKVKNRNGGWHKYHEVFEEPIEDPAKEAEEDD